MRCQNNHHHKMKHGESWRIAKSISTSRITKITTPIYTKSSIHITKNESDQVSVNFTTPIKGPKIMDEHSPSIKFIIRGQEIAYHIIDGGSGLNFINKTTYDRPRITEQKCARFGYCLNPSYTVRVKEEIDKIGFIMLVKKPIVLVQQWLYPREMVKSGFKVQAMVADAFPLPFMDGVLNVLARHEIYSFLDGFSGYNQI